MSTRCSVFPKLFIFLWMLFDQARSASNPVTWTTDPRFVGGQIAYSPSGTGFVSQSLIYPYVTALTSASRLVALGIVDYEYRLDVSAYYMTLRNTGIGDTAFQVEFNTSSGSSLKVLRFCYLAVDSTFTDPFSISYFTSTNNVGYAGPFSLTFYINFTASTGVVLNLSHSNAMLAFQHLIDVDSPSGCFQINIGFQLFNQSYYEVVISTTCALRMYTFGFSRIIFDKTAIQAMGYCFFQFGELQATNGNTATLAFSTSPFFASNFMLGMKSFHVDVNKLKFTSSIGAATSVSSTVAFKFLSFMYWSFKKRVCPASFPYFQVSTSLCFDTCPAGTYGDASTMMCLACSYTCQTCSSFSVCTNCDPATNRYQNGTTCPPSPGYFDNQTSNTVACSSVLTASCLQCTDNVTCTNCTAGTYLSSGTCHSCSSSSIANCSNCSMVSGALQCDACLTGFILSANKLTCTYNPCTDPNCATCASSFSICDACTTGYNVTASSTCATVCGDGTMAGTEQCDDGNTVDGDGCNSDCTTGNNNGCLATVPYRDPVTNSCVAACPSGYYTDPTAYTCPSCGYTCATCVNATACDTCSPTSNRYLNGTSCLPSSGFFDNGTQIAPACVSPCVQCSSLSSCITCVVGYYISGTSCTPCSSITANCNGCNAAGTTCTNCSLGYLLNASTLVCDVVPCTVTGCVSCPTSNSICQGCATGFYLVSGNCNTVCGDGTMAGAEQCDDNNTIDGDGCNADCTTGNNHGCLATVPYRDPVTNSCIAACPSGYFGDPVAYTCTLCGYTCGTCPNATACDSCSPTSNRYLNGTSCLPSPGFFDNGTLIAPACVSPCGQCSSLSSCTTCVTGYYISGTSCTPCSSITANCSECYANGSACTACQSGFLLNATTLACDVVPCYDPKCVACSNSMAVCTTCTTGFQAINGACQTICGDFFVTSSEACDDGNSIDKDGCSSSCSVETDFTCEPDAVTPAGSACFYIGTVSVTEVYINKVDGENKIKIQLDLSPSDLAFWNSVNFLDMIQIQTPVPITGYDVVRNPDGTVSITVSYASDIQDQPMTITVDPTRANLPALSRASPSTTNLVITPDDNKGAYFYDGSIYDMANIISTLCTATSALAGVFYVLALISVKMIGVEMMAVVQISFFSLVTLSQLNPCFAALSSLKLVNGYNSLNHNHLADQLTPKSPKGIFLFSRFTENFNFTVAIILVPLLVALICFILSKTALKENERVPKVAKKAVAEYTLMGLLFGGYMIAVSFALEIMYGMKKNEDFIGKVSLAECAVLLLLMVGYFVFLLLKPEPEFFGEFIQEFKKDRVSSKYYNYMLVERVLVGSCLVFLLSTNIGAIVPLVVFLLTGIFVAVKKPYRENYQNYRVIANMSIALAVEAVYLAYTMIPAGQRNGMPIFFYLPFIICALLIACVIYNGVAIIYGIYKLFKSQNADKEMLQEQNEEIAKFRNETMLSMNIPTSPTNLSASVSPLSMRQAFSDPEMLRKKSVLNELKKQMVKVNPEKADLGFVNQILLERDKPANAQLINAYDAI